jgi:hypothetical protein
MFGRRFKWVKLSLALLVASLWISGCGYTPAPILPQHIKNIAIVPFANTTVRYGIEEKLANAVTNEFLRDGRLNISKEQQADATLTGTVTKYVLEPVSYDEQDVIQQYKLWITVDLVFTDLTDNTVLWEHKDMMGSVNYFVTPTAGELVETEDEAQDRLVEDMSRDITRRTIEGW